MTRCPCTRVHITKLRVHAGTSNTALARAASDATSRGGTPRRGRSQPPSRPTSAPPRPPRFDPTAYVRDRRAREAASVERARRATFSPASSRPGSAHSSPRAPPRSRSAGSACREQGARQRARSSSESSARGPLSVRTAQGTHAESPARRGAGSPAAPRQRDYARRPWGGASRDASARRRLSSGAEPDSRAASPGRALQQVKTKISEYKRRTEAAAAYAPPRSESDASRRGSEAGADDTRIGAVGARSGGGGHEGYQDASEEIADIDTRLQALQDFLRSAKAGA